MTISIQRLCLLLLLALAGVLLKPAPAQANVVCSLNNSPSLSFGSATTGQGTIGYSCTNYGGSAVSFTLCAGIGNPSYPGTVSQPVMQASGGGTANFNVYTNAADTQIWSATNPVTSTTITIGAAIGSNAQGILTFYGAIAPNQGSAAGSYTAYFYNTVLGFPVGSTCQTRSADGNYSGLDFTLPITANVVSACVVSASPTLNLGTVTAGTSNINGSNALQVSCPTGTAYYVGLRPSNNSTAGAGVMAGSSGNRSTVAYQLRSSSATGPAWGSTATSSSAGNGVAGIGNGTYQSYTVYATTGDTDVTPDTYTDTVTVLVNY